MPIAVAHFTDPGCPWAYSVNPALTVLRWRYGDQLAWRTVMIGLTENREQYRARGYTPAAVAQGYRVFRRRGMPFATQPRAHVPATGRACRAVVAARLLDPALEWPVFRALQIAWFTTTLALDEDEQIGLVLDGVKGLVSRRILDTIDDEEVGAAYEAGRAEARTASRSPTEFQGKAAATDGPVRYTAPSLIFTFGERRLEAGGFQPLEAYDVLVANLDPTIDRTPAAAGPREVLDHFPEGLTTQEIAAVMAAGNDEIDRGRAEEELIDLVARAEVRRVPLGQDALWQREPTASRSR